MTTPCRHPSNRGKVQDDPVSVLPFAYPHKCLELVHSKKFETFRTLCSRTYTPADSSPRPLGYIAAQMQNLLS
jgi:hypothetical protein